MVRLLSQQRSDIFELDDNWKFEACAPGIVATLFLFEMAQ